VACCGHLDLRSEAEFVSALRSNTPDASPDELKSLGAALDGWFDGYLAELATAGRDADGWIDRDSLADLLGGELPQPLALRCASPGMTLTAMRDALDRARALVPRPRGGSGGDGGRHAGAQACRMCRGGQTRRSRH
jgi:hypothetical protein